MDKSKTLLAVVIAMMLGGCGQMGSSPEEEPEKTPAEMDPADLPQISAFQKDFSRQFMESTEQVEEGYYLLRSGIDAFTIYFPEEATLMENAYGSDGDHYEKLRFVYENDNENRGYTIDFQYNLGGNATRPDWKLDGLRKKWSYEGEWNKIENEQSLLYYGAKQEDSGTVMIFGYNISSTEDHEEPKAIEFSQMVTCIDESADCNLDLEKEERYVLKWVKSISFIN
ncbi:hypothetical protein J26TS2_33410 [Shouchella clausii]|nr:hypothetical protein J26TS2_33410 [Shouchella clausii]